MAQDTSKKVLSLAMGTNAGLSALAGESGRIIFVTDTGKMYIDATDTDRIAVNAAHADTATSADKAAKWSTARTIKIGSTGKSVDGSESSYEWTHAQIGATVSNAWGAGTTAGPTLTTTVNGVASAAQAIPAASASASGVVTTDKQTFKGAKTFQSAITVPSISGTAAGWTTSRNFTINSAAADDAVPVNGKSAVALNIPKTLTGFTSITSAAFVGALTGNADTATTASATVGTLTIKGNGTKLGTFNGSADKSIDITAANIGALPASTKYAGSSSAGGPAKSVANSLTIGGKTYNGSAAISISLADLGLANAIHFIGSTSTSLTDGATTASITIDSTTYVTGTPTSSQKKINTGDVVLNSNKEFIWTGSAWEELGDESSHALKTVSITGSGALEGGGNLSANRTITHKTYNNAGKTVGTSTASISGSGAKGTLYIPQITVDTYGHITYSADTAVSITMPTLPTLRNFTVATSTDAATAATTSVTYDPDGSANKTFTIYKMKGATTSAAGFQGLVPAPAALNTDADGQTIYTALRGDGTWGEPTICWSTF